MKTHRLRFWALLPIALVWLPLAALAQTQMEMNDQAEKDFEASDAKLNVIYQKVLKKLDAIAVAKLKRTERAWLVYRDAEADLEADQNRGGTIMPMVYSGAAMQITDRRIAELQAFYDEIGN